MWHVIRIAYFDQDKLPLLVGPLPEAIASLREIQHVRRLMLTSHWKFGPHVDIHVDCPPTAFSDVFASCSGIVGGWLRAHPSEVVLDPVSVR